MRVGVERLQLKVGEFDDAKIKLIEANVVKFFELEEGQKDSEY